MATYTTEQLLTSVLSTEFYSAKTIDAAIESLSGEIGDITDKISVDINPRLSSIANAVSAHIEDINDLSVSLTGAIGDINDLKTINAQMAEITTLATDGSVSTLSVIAKVNEIINIFKQP